MSFIMRRIILVLLFFTVSCGGGENPDLRESLEIPDNQKVSGELFHILPGSSGLSVVNNTVAGTGSIRFASALRTVRSDYNFELGFSLDPGGELTFVSHALRGLNSGIELRFVRADNDELALIARIEERTEDWSLFFQSVAADSFIHLSIDIHNDHGPYSHIIIWDMQTGVELFDSAMDASQLGRGYGANWGIKLNNATLNLIGKGPPRDAH